MDNLKIHHPHGRNHIGHMRDSIILLWEDLYNLFCFDFVMLMSNVIPHLTEFKWCEGNIGQLVAGDEDCTWAGSDKEVEWIRSELKGGKDPKYFNL